MTSSDDFWKKNRTRQRAVREVAEHWSNTRGGDVEDHMREADRNVAYDEKPYRDDNLTDAGFREVKTYDYKSADETFLYQVVRYEHPNVPGAKKFRQRRHGRNVRDSVEWVADAGLAKVPYNWPELAARPTETVFYTEGEKDADRLDALELLATTLAGQQWSLAAARALAGRCVVILADNDERGREHAVTAATNLHGFAASVKIVELPGLQRTQDVSDWLDEGHTKEELLQIVGATRPQGVQATPFEWINPTLIRKRRWLYKPHYIRQFCSLTISTGGVGKSSLVIVEAIGMVSGKALLGVQPEVQPEQRKLHVWYWNGEDPTDELVRRIAAALKHFSLGPDDIGSRLFVNSGRTYPIVIAEEIHREVRVNEQVVQDIIRTIQDRKIDVVIIDPFVTCHRVNENDNAAIERVVKSWSHIAEATNSAVMLVHHSKKTGGDGATVEDGRGASALLAAARSARSLNTMTKEEAKNAGVEERDRRLYFRSDIGKANLARPAEAADWFKLASVDLGNYGDDFWQEGDNVGVVTAWRYPVATMPPVSNADIRRAQQSIRDGGPWRFDQRSVREPWVGIPIARALNLDRENNLMKKNIVRLIDSWLDEGLLKRVPGQNAHREQKEYIEVGEDVDVLRPADPNARSAYGSGQEG
jgi:hypothetical protein